MIMMTSPPNGEDDCSSSSNNNINTARSEPSNNNNNNNNINEANHTSSTNRKRGSNSSSNTDEDEVHTQKNHFNHNNDDGNNDKHEHDEEHSNEATENSQDKDCLASKIDVLRATLEQVRKDTESEIGRLRQELVMKNKTLEQLQEQLTEQRDYQMLKKQKEILNATANDNENDEEVADKWKNKDEDESSTSVDQTTTPLGLSDQTKGLEMFLLQRAKALQYANPALKALVDLQAASGFKPWFGDLMKPSGLPDYADPFLAWKKTLEQQQQAMLPASTAHSTTQHNTPSSTYPPTPSPRSPSNQSATPDRGNTPSVDQRSSPQSQHCAANGSSIRTSVTDEDNSNKFTLNNSSFKTENQPSMLPLPPGLMSQSPSAASLMSSGRIPKSDPIEGALQDMLRYNMEKYAGQSLDTLGAARRVRELLSVHNIGQRLFAKYVLGLSQGTVSELLSKPKSWEKLTEKGRDSYRKMHAWAYDENAIMMLKSLIPRKGELSRQTRNHLVQPFTPEPIPGENGPPSTAMLPSSVDHMRGPKFPGDHPFMSRYPFPSTIADTFGKSRLPFVPPITSESQIFDTKKLNDDLEARISKCNQDKAWDKEKAGNDAMKDALQRLPFPSFGGFMGKSGEEMQRAVEMYQAELAKLQKKAMMAMTNQSNTDGNPGDLSDQKSGDTENDEKKAKDTNTGEEHKENFNAIAEAAQKFRPTLQMMPSSGIPPPPPPPAHSLPMMSSASPPESSSPLQGMASITNSLTTTQTSGLGSYRPSQRSFKAILPPITQEQFDRYDNIDTEQVVRKVKEVLSQYSISQRLFGESVLGLSQGSVSDLLARPKQFHMLTQKGKEPFIRMKLFLEDEQAVHRLVASQYKISPDKLMRTGPYTNSYLPASMAAMSGMFNQKHLQQQPGQKLPEMSVGTVGTGNNPFLLRPPLSEATGLLPPPPRMPGIPDSFDPFSFHRKLQEQQQRFSAAATMNLGKMATPPNSIYEMAALTQELNTLQLTNKVRETLSANNIGQKLFGEAILGLSQGSVSELLTKPKPWHMLSIKGREPFIRMHLWLNDPHKVEKLQQLKEERDSLKRKRESGNSGPSSPDPYEFGSNSMGSPTNSAKKPRASFTNKQKEALKIAYSLDPYPSPTVMEFLSQELGLETRSIINWFHNHRMRLKQTCGNEQEQQQQQQQQQQPNKPFDPIHFRLLVHQRYLDLGDETPGSPGSGSQQQCSSNKPEDLSTGNRSNAGSSCDLDEDEGDSNSEALLVQTLASSNTNSSGGNGGRSRSRKPIAPQWVDPSAAAAAAAAAVASSNSNNDMMTSLVEQSDKDKIDQSEEEF